MQLWIARVSLTPTGHKLRAAFCMLENLDVLDASWGGGRHRPDRAPRDILAREVQGALEDALGKRKLRD